MKVDNEKKQEVVLDVDLDIIRNFENNEFEKLLKYVKDNQNCLRNLLHEEYSTEISATIKLGSTKLHDFEKIVMEDKKILTVFKLGMLYGYFDYLNQLEYEKVQYSRACTHLDTIINLVPELGSEVKNIITILYLKKTVQEKELLEKIPINHEETVKILHVLFIEGFVHLNNMCEYSLSEKGIRVAKQLEKQRKNVVHD